MFTRSLAFYIFGGIEMDTFLLIQTGLNMSPMIYSILMWQGLVIKKLA